MINLESTGPRIYARLATKPKQKFGLFDKFSFALTGAFEVAKKTTYF